MRRPVHTAGRGGAAGFTLVELLVVIAIIGLIVALVLVAAADGVRRAEERATQSLITKLETGVADRLDALLNNQAPINQTHRYLAAINYDNGTGNVPVGSSGVALNSEERRAQVIAQFDYLRSEMPDVFFLNAKTSDGTSLADYFPLNFAGLAYPGPGSPATIGPYYLPLGNLSPGLPYYNDPTNPFKSNDKSTWYLTTNPTQGLLLAYQGLAPYTPPISGIFGASFSAMGGITKNLGYAPKGYDGIDNDGVNGIDDLGEGTPAGMTTTDFRTQVNGALARHTHKTARSEMLYAVLVEGVGPLGSVFNRDEFTDREVRDTDGDGLPEFVDAWGEPLQFYRWPIYYGVDAPLSGSETVNQKNRLGTDSQKGPNAYNGYVERREQNQLDPNQLLVSPGWWAAAGNVGLSTSTTTTPTFGVANTGGTYGTSQGAMAFMRYFQLLVDPGIDWTGETKEPTGTNWDRSGLYKRRAYFSKYLILSGGPDKEPGVGQFGKNYSESTGISGLSSSDFPDGSLTMDQNSVRLILIENQASQTDPSWRLQTGNGGSFYEKTESVANVNSTSTTTDYLQNVFGLDDISNHNTQAPTTGVR